MTRFAHAETQELRPPLARLELLFLICIVHIVGNYKHPYIVTIKSYKSLSFLTGIIIKIFEIEIDSKYLYFNANILGPNTIFQEVNP